MSDAAYGDDHRERLQRIQKGLPEFERTTSQEQPRRQGHSKLTAENLKARIAGEPAAPADLGVLTMSVLDHGFVTLRNIAGPTRRVCEPAEHYEVPENIACKDHYWHRDFDADDIDPAQAARMSFDQFDSTRTREADLKLCNYLMKNRHTSPFEMIEVWLEMKLPIFVARQFVRHRTVSLNEVSGRYVTLPAEWYIPQIVGGKPINAKQGQSDTLIERDQKWFKDLLRGHCKASYGLYEAALKQGIAPEHARLFLHLNHYTHWLWKQDLHNIMHFLSLRDHSHAQVEAQAYARAVDKLIRNVLPETMKLYDEFRKQE